MNILISVCEAFLIPAKAMLYSLAQHNEGLKIYQFCGSLTSGQIEDLRGFVQEKCNAELISIDANGYFEDVPLSKQYGKPELYFRLLAPYILPQEMERILYMDADMIVNGSLEEFYNQSFEDAYAVVASDRFYFCDEVQMQKKKLGMGEDDIYFNSGLILFHLKRFRENISFRDIMDFIKKNRENLFYFDQDILNCLLLNHKKLCDGKYNFQAYPFEALSVSDVQDKVVLHYTDRPKPWENNYTGNLAPLYRDVLVKAELT